MFHELIDRAWPLWMYYSKEARYPGYVPEGIYGLLRGIFGG
jgi:hypothetical protein